MTHSPSLSTSENRTSHHEFYEFTTQFKSVMRFCKGKVALHCWMFGFGLEYLEIN